jgi:hypothetical protein
MEKTVQGNFAEILKKALVEMPEGKIDFRGPANGLVSVIFIEGDILLVDSTWGTGKNELQRILDWGTGTCVIRDLTFEEKRTLETKWQRPVILEKGKKGTRDTISLKHPVAVQPLFRDLKCESIDLDAFLADIQLKKYSGEARITTPQGRNSILFYQGFPLISSGRKIIAKREASEIMNTPGATLNFYLLGDELAHAYASVLQGERVWEGLSVTMLHLDKMLDKLMEKHPTGHLCIHKENGARQYCLFFQGKPLGVYEIEKDWSPVDIVSMWEDTKQVDYYLSAQMKSFLSRVVEVSAAEDFWKFITLWNNLVEVIAKKLGKKPVKKSLKKQFGGLDMYTLKDIRLQPAGARDRSDHDALETFKVNVPVFLKEMETITGSQWLTRQLQDFQKMNADIIARLSLDEALSPKGG